MSRYTALGEMASTLAHELNQPLAAIHMSGAAARLLSDLLDNWSQTWGD